jgi:hypothetical protein
MKGKCFIQLKLGLSLETPIGGYYERVFISKTVSYSNKYCIKLNAR